MVLAVCGSNYAQVCSISRRNPKGTRFVFEIWKTQTSQVIVITSNSYSKEHWTSEERNYSFDRREKAHYYLTALASCLLLASGYRALAGCWRNASLQLRSSAAGLLVWPTQNRLIAGMVCSSSRWNLCVMSPSCRCTSWLQYVWLMGLLHQCRWNVFSSDTSSRPNCSSHCLSFRSWLYGMFKLSFMTNNAPLFGAMP